jgi:hypothetical protein
MPKLIDCLRPKAERVAVGIWSDDHKLLEAARKVKAQGYQKFDAISPFPIHGIEAAIGIAPSFIPWVTFIFGSLGCTFGVWFTWWVSAVDWPLNIGGKPMWSLPAFVPIIFECTILFGALSSVIAMFAANGLPKIDPLIIDPTLTSHRFALYVSPTDPKFDEQKVLSMFRELGAEEVRMAEF